MCDLQFSYTPSFATMQPVTRKGWQWAKRNISKDTVMCSNQYIVDHRWLADIVHAARDAGLVCEG